MIILETERLVLREMNDSDFLKLKDILSDSFIMKYYPKPYDDEGVRNWINWCKASYQKRGFGLWAVLLKENGVFIGDTGISMQNINGKEVPEIGYHYHSNYWHKGYALEAAKACKKWLFENTDFNEVYSYMNALNTPSENLAKANGMHFVEEYILDGAPYKVYSINKEEYLNSCNNN